MGTGSKTKYVSSYAKAFLEASESKGVLKQVYEDMKRLHSMIKCEYDIIKYLSNPEWSVEDKKSALEEVAKKNGLNDISLSCLSIVAENNRFSGLVDILEQFEDLYYEKMNLQKVEVVTAIELTEAQDKKLQSSLEKIIDKKVVIKYEIKPEILGGLLVQFGSKMIDDTLKGKLEQVELLMKGKK